jgi:hypothetical protein
VQAIRGRWPVLRSIHASVPILDALFFEPIAWAKLEEPVLTQRQGPKAVESKLVGQASNAPFRGVPGHLTFERT